MHSEPSRIRRVVFLSTFTPTIFVSYKHAITFRHKLWERSTKSDTETNLTTICRLHVILISFWWQKVEIRLHRTYLQSSHTRYYLLQTKNDKCTKMCYIIEFVVVVVWHFLRRAFNSHWQYQTFKLMLLLSNCTPCHVRYNLTQTSIFSFENCSSCSTHD